MSKEDNYMEVKINISLKQGVLDPQGRAVESALISLGYSEAKNVRIGKQSHLKLKLKMRAVPSSVLPECVRRYWQTQSLRIIP